LGGALVGLFLAAQVYSSPWRIGAGMRLVALWSNGLNQLGRRPGRALKIFVPLLAGLLFWEEGRRQFHLLLPLLTSALVLLPRDLREDGMLGDSGANALGAALGVYLLLFFPFYLQLVWLGA